MSHAIALYSGTNKRGLVNFMVSYDLFTSLGGDFTYSLPILSTLR